MVRSARSASLVTLLSLSALSAGLAPGRDPAEIALDRRLPEIKFESTPLSEALDTLRDLSGLNLRIEWTVLEAAGVDRTVPVTFRLRGVSVRKILSTLLREAGAGATLAYEVDEGIVFVTTQEQADKKLSTEVYDVRDLMFSPIMAGQPPELETEIQSITRGGGGGGGGSAFQTGGNTSTTTDTQTPEQRGQGLADLIVSLIRPEVWNVNGGPASIRYFRGTLIVSAPRSVHELIGDPVKP